MCRTVVEASKRENDENSSSYFMGSKAAQKMHLLLIGNLILP